MVIWTVSDTKILQLIFNGQTSIRQDIKKVEGKVNSNGSRIDKLGGQLAYLEDHVPTNEEFDKFKKRVGRVEKQVVSN